MNDMKIAFKIEPEDNVATALMEIDSEPVKLRGAGEEVVTALEKIPEGHKIAVRDISQGETILKYAVPIGRATRDIAKGAWISLHCMESIYDERSSHLDSVTGKPKDIRYE